MSKFQDGATYPQIKAYMLDHIGLKVSSLNISQVKRKYRLEVGKNYNLQISENSRHASTCSLEKENAIREALQYFEMICIPLPIHCFNSDACARTLYK